MPRRGVQQAEERGGREQPGEGPSAHPAALPALGRVAREHPSPRVRRGRHSRPADRRHPRRLRFSTRTAGRRGDRVRSGRPRDRVRLESRRGRSRGLDDQSRCLDRADRRRRGEEDHDQPRVRPAAGVFIRRPHAVRACAAASRLRIRSMVHRRLRPLERDEAYRLHVARSLGRGLFTEPRWVPVVHRRTGRARGPLRRPCRRRRAEVHRDGGRDLRGAARTGIRGVLEINAHGAGRDLPRRRQWPGRQTAHARERVVARGRRLLTTREPQRHQRRRREDPGTGCSGRRTSTRRRSIRLSF